MKSLRKLQAELHAQRQPRPITIIRKYARPHPDGRRLMKCTPSRIEVARDDPLDLRSVGKYIYDTPELAEACARELRDAGHGPSYVYPCHRSKHGHVHLTSQRPPNGRRRW